MTAQHPDHERSDQQRSDRTPIVTLRPTTRLRFANGGRFLVGGSPATLLRLTDSGAERVRAWFAGDPVGSSDTERALARRLTINGMAETALHKEHANPAPATYSVVIPVYNDAEGLTATLTQLGNRSVIVVDNGSHTPVVATDDVEVVRTDNPTSPADARNTGLRHVGWEHPVVFVDAGVEISGESLDQLVATLDDPTGAPMLAAAPRVRSRRERGSIAVYEEDNSPLDLGPVGADVAPGKPVSYVPSACIALSPAGINAGRLGNGDLFDTSLRYGEDVDLIWRISAHGSIRYRPDIEATHPPRTGLRAFIEQRVNYGSAAGPLGTRHGEHITPFRTSSWGAIVAIATVTGHRAIAIGAAAVSMELVRRRLPGDLEGRTGHAARLVGAAHTNTVVALGAAAVRPWWPATALLATMAPHTALRLLGVGVVRRLIGSRHEWPSGLKPINVGLGLLDDLAYGTGVWRGCAATGSLRALLPTISGSFRER